MSIGPGSGISTAPRLRPGSARVDSRRHHEPTLPGAHGGPHRRPRQGRVLADRVGPGVPLLGGRRVGDVRRLRRVSDAAPRSFVMVYEAPPDHPMGLAPGDIVLGTRVDPGPSCYPEMLANGLPVTGFWGRSEASYEHAWSMAAGANWHLFDTIDVRRRGPGVRAPSHVVVDRLVESDVVQRTAPGALVSDARSCQPRTALSWGIIEGTTIGYIYGWGWAWDAEREFHDAVDALMTTNEPRASSSIFASTWAATCTSAAPVSPSSSTGWFPPSTG